MMQDAMPKNGCPQYCCDGSDPEDLMITGMSGRFPLSDNIEELQAGLYSKKEFIVPNEMRWQTGTLKLKSNKSAVLKDLTKFDANFFGVSYAEAEATDPSQRIILEVCYEAMADSGYDPNDFRGQKIGVYCALSQYDAKDLITRETEVDKYDLRLYNTGLNAGRCSYAFDLKGPSFVVDTACSSSGVAFSCAFNDLKEGRVDAAIVAGMELCINAEMHINYIQLKISSDDGTNRPFDAQGHGMSRGESLVAIFVQKASKARRVYAKILHSSLNSSGYLADGMYVPSKNAQMKAYVETLEKSGVNPLDIDYIEAHGTGTIVGDPIEVESLSEVYCPGRKTPLLIGTIKSNIGHTEAAAGLCGIVKSVLAFETGLICPNLYYETPNPRCTALIDGSVEVVTENTPLTSDYIAINSFGFGGTNAHMIIKKNVVEYKPSTLAAIPELVLYAATTYEGVEYTLQRISKSENPKDFFCLFRNLAYASMLSKPYRGYALISPTPSVDIQLCSHRPKEVWYVLTGLGCYWPGMGSKLMNINIFAESIKWSSKVLKPLGIDLLKFIASDVSNSSPNLNFTSNIVSVCAIQIALLDVLKHLGIIPNGIIGHSIGELACAYADGCLTAEEAILSAYYVGKAIESSKVAVGAMAVVEMAPEQIKTFFLKDVHIVSYGPEGYVTISGLEKPVKQFVTKLTKENKFAVAIDTCGYPLHSPYMNSTTPAIKRSLEKIIAKPRSRSSLWLTTSYSTDHNNNEDKKMLDSDYIANNLKSHVGFADAIKHIPLNSIIIEVSPDTLLQFKLGHGRIGDICHVNLMKNGEGVNCMLEKLGRLYCMGLDPRIEVLYSPPQYPVPRATPAISSLIKWDHSISYFVPKYFEDKANIRFPIRMNTHEQYLLDHYLDGKPLFPATGYIWLIWKALALKMRKEHTEVPILIEDFKIHRATILSAKEDKMFKVFISSSDGKFEISESETIVSTGKISSPNNMKFRPLNPVYQNLDAMQMLSGQEMYSELKIRGYEYGPYFQGITEISIDGTQGRIKWNNKWISYLDAHLLFFGIVHDKHFSLPVGARFIKIDPKQALSYIEKQENDSEGTPVRFERYIQCCSSPGIEIRFLRAEVTQQRLTSTVRPILEECQFLPYDQECAIPRGIIESAIEYINVCNTIANRVAGSIQKMTGKNLLKCEAADLPSGLLERYLNPKEPNKNHVLLRFLNKAENFKFPSDNTKFFLKNYTNSIGDDILYKTLFNEYTLRIILEIIAENTQGKMNVTELFNGSQPILPLANDILKKFYNCKLNCMLFHPEPEFLDVDAFKKGNIDIKVLEAENNLQASLQDVVISSFLFGNEENLKSHINLLISLVHNRSFILLYHKSVISSAELFLSSLCEESVKTVSTSDFVDILHEFNLTIIAEKSDTFGGIMYLLRYDINDIIYTYDTIINITDGYYDEWVEELKQAMASVNEQENGRIWLVAEDSQNNGIVGMVKCLKQEPGGDKIRCVHIFKDDDTSEIPPFDLNNTFYSEVVKRDVLMNVYQNGRWGSFKHMKISAEPESKLIKHSCIQCMLYGDLSSFQWLESNLPYKWDLENGEELVYVYYTGLNFRDVMIATGKLSISTIRDEHGEIPFCPLGFEFSGITSRGRRVMGMGSSQCLATTIILSETQVMDVPDHWSLEEAATIPVVYSTAYFALITKGKLKHGESLLIHSGTGGVGIAAIKVAMSLNCQIFVTVGTAEKREYLKKLFPEIEDDFIGCSRDTSFVNMVLKKTKGKGVDVVLNSLAEEKLQAGTRCLAKGGRFMEIGKYDLSIDNPIGLSIFDKGATFAGVLLDQMFFHRWNLQLCSITDLVMEGVRKGVVQPLERTVFAHGEVENAFRYMATGKHVGKVVLKIQDEPPRGAVPRPLEQKVKPSLYFYSRKTYIIIGGLGGFGIELTKWILQNGAQNVIITTRYGARTAYHQLCLLRWKHSEKNVKVLTLDVSKREEAKQLLEEVSQIGPIGGIFNSAVVLNDAFMENQSSQFFKDVCGPKATASMNLDELSRDMCPELDYFVCFSSISCGKGNAGQTNYGYANSVMERICEKRRKEGLHGLAIQWGIIGDVGVLHRQIGEDAMIAGVVAQKITSCLSTLEQFLLLDQAVLCSYVTVDVSTKGRPKQDDALSQLAKIFGFPSVTDIKVTRTFREMGMDSMIGVELQHFLELNYDISLSIKELQDMTVNDLQTLIQSKSEAEQSTTTTKPRDKSVALKFLLPQLLIPEVAILPLNSKQVGTPVIIVHHSESEIMKAQALARLLDYPAYGLLSTKETSMHNITTVAASYLKEINDWSTDCHLVGLTSCSALAFEIYLQSRGRTDDNASTIKSFIILAGSLNFANALSGTWKTIPKEETEVSDLYNILKQFSTSDVEAVREALLKKNNYEAKQAYVVSLLSSSCNEGAGNVADAIRRYIKVMDMCRNYNPTTQMAANIKIIETTATLLANDVSLVKSSLSKVCCGQISIKRVPGSENFLNEPDTFIEIANLMNSSYQNEDEN